MKRIIQKIKEIKATGQSALLNLIGLIIGLCSVAIISVWVWSHLSFDRHLPNHDQLHLLTYVDTTYNDADVVMPFPMAQTLRDNFPELQHTVLTHIWPDSYKIVANGKEFFEEITPCEKTFFDVFELSLLASNTKPLSSPKDIALSESVAQKMFGSNNCIGEIVHLEDSITLTVAAVFSDLPENTTFRPKVLCNFNASPELFINCEGWNSYCYVLFTKLPIQSNVVDLGNQITQMMYKDHEFEECLQLLPISDMHLSTPGEPSKTKTIWMISLAGLLVMLVSCINFINLEIAHLYKKLPRSIIKKVLGAKVMNIVRESILESFIYVFSAFLVSLFISFIFVPIISSHIDLDILKICGHGWFVVIHLVAALLVFIIVSVYPALKTVHLFRKQQTLSVSVKHNPLGKVSRSFVVVQFLLAILIGIGAFTMQKQIKYALSIDKGYDDTNVVFAELWDYPWHAHRAEIEQFLDSNPDVESYSVAENSFSGLGSRTSGYKPANWDENQKAIYKVMYRADENLLNTMGIKLLAGRFLNPEKFADNDNIVINETFAHMLGGLDSALTTTLDKKYHVVGVCKDIMFESIYSDVEPMLIKLDTHGWMNNLLIKTIDGKEEQVIQSLNAMLRYRSEAPFKIKKHSTLVYDQYAEEEIQRKIISLFGILTIIVSALGLFSLTVLTLEQRTKEIGIRKVNGATVTEIMTMLNGSFVKWVAIAFVIACPIAYYAMSQWLENFAYKTELSWWIFALAGVLALVIALLTVSWQSWRAARRNPVESLRSE